MIWQWESKPFGETKPNEDPDKDGLSLHYNQRFPGQTFDAETGLHYNFHRYYNPQTGRYVQSDPIGLDGGMNSFGYVEGNPVAALDILGHAPTYIVGQLNRVIDVSLDAHQESEMKGAIALINKFPKIKFTVYIYSRDKGFTSDLRSAGARAVGLHIDPVSPSAGPMTTQISDFYGTGKGLPASIHGKGGTRLPTTAMSALKAKSAPFVRAADNTGGVGGSPPVVLSFGGSATIPTIQNNRAVTHYFTHPNPESNPGTTAFTTLTYFNRYAQ